MKLQDSVEQLFADNPDLSKAEAIKRLKEEKTPGTNKAAWKSATIRSAVSTYLNKREKKVQVVHVESLVETMDPRSNLKIEGKEIERHKPKDPFAIELDRNVEKEADRMEETETAVDAERFKKGTLDDVSKKIPNHASIDAKPFKDEILSIVSDFISEVRKEFSNDRKEILDLKKEVSNLRTQGIPTYKPAIRYNDLRLRQSTIDLIRENTEDRELEDESEYIDILIANHYEPIVKNEDYYKHIVEYDEINLRQSVIDTIQKNTEEKGLREESEYIDILMKNEEKYTLKVLKIPLQKISLCS